MRIVAALGCCYIHPTNAGDNTVRPTIYIMRGQSGSGKSTWIANNLGTDSPSTVICSADHYFTATDGSYHFDPAELPQAHEYCWNKALAAIDARRNVIAIDNTNVDPQHVRRYVDAARIRGYRIVVVTCLTSRTDRGVHGCPEHVAARHREMLIAKWRPWHDAEYVDVDTH